MVETLASSSENKKHATYFNADKHREAINFSISYCCCTKTSVDLYMAFWVIITCQILQTWERENARGRGGKRHIIQFTRVQIL